MKQRIAKKIYKNASALDHIIEDDKRLLDEETKLIQKIRHSIFIDESEETVFKDELVELLTSQINNSILKSIFGNYSKDQLNKARMVVTRSLK